MTTLLIIARMLWALFTADNDSDWSCAYKGPSLVCERELCNEEGCTVVIAWVPVGGPEKE